MCGVFLGGIYRGEEALQFKEHARAIWSRVAPATARLGTPRATLAIQAIGRQPGLELAVASVDWVDEFMGAELGDT